MKHKKLFLILALALFAVMPFAQRGYDGTHLYDLGLPDGEEVGSSLLKAIPLLLIGFLICWFTMWRKEKQESGSEPSNWGCVGCAIMVVGGFFLLPLLAWVELIFQSALGIGIAIAVVVGIIALIISFFSKK